MKSIDRGHVGAASDARCVSTLVVLLDDTSGWLPRARARLHALSCPACACDLSTVDPRPLLPAMRPSRIRPRRRVLRWVLPVATALVAWLAQGCVHRTDAPCAADADCRAAGDVCDEGRCVRPACVDGDLRPCVVGAGPGCAGVRRCAGGVFGVCAAPPERCDGLDDDCDGAVDEGFPDLGDACEVGRGACLAEGVLVCTADGAATTCGAVASMGRPETCDGVDDDCDGRVDEQVGAGEPCRQGIGACAAEGVERCIPARGGLICDADEGSPSDEACNGLDDDCDGAVDEVEGVGRPCSVGLGACAADGLMACDVAEGLVCTASAGPPAVETCNGVDDDCDGVVDDVDGVGEPCHVGRGACASEGVVACGPDGPVCSAVPGEPGLELCGNRVDDDCDGEVDDRASCLVGCGNGRREGDEACDDGGVLDGDGCSAECRVEPGFVCLDGPPDTPVVLDGRVGCEGWMPVDAPAWIGGYAVAYAGGAVAFAVDPPRFSTAYAVRVAEPDGAIVLQAGVLDDGVLAAAETADDAVEAALGRVDILHRGAYEVAFPDALCADNAGAVEVEFRTLDDCRPACADDGDCVHLGHACADGRCVPRAPACGDGERDPGEGCDDGNLADGDGCDAGCALEPGFTCSPVAMAGPIDVVPGSGLAGPNWQSLDDGRTIAQRANGAPTHFATGVPIGSRFVTRFSLEVARVDDDFVGWSIGGGATPLTAPEAPYLLFSWKRATQGEPELGLAARGLRVGQVSGPVDHVDLWRFEGANLEVLTAAATLDDSPFTGRGVHVISIVGDSERLRVFVDGVLEFDLADVPLGDGRLGLYNYSQEAMFVTRLGPLGLDVCAPTP